MSDDITHLEALKQSPEKFGFFFALRCLECASDQSPRLGESLRPGTDPVRLGQTPSLSFANSTIASFREQTASSPPKLNSYFLGLFGPHGALPLHLTEYAKDREIHENDPTFARFVDMFHHRILSFFYRAWANKEPTVCFDRADTDPFKKYIGALFGQGMPSFHHRDELPDRAKLLFSGLFSKQIRNTEGLAAILSGYLNIPVEIEEFVGEWMPLPADNQWQLGLGEESGMLGENTLIGDKVWSCQNKIRLHFGPLTLLEFKRFLPGGEDLKRVTAIVKNYMGFQFSWETNLILSEEEKPELVLGQKSQLGCSTWLHTKVTKKNDFNIAPAH